MSASATDVPNFGLLLAPVIGELTPAEQAAFLGRLERAAAGRYRAWAEQAPQHAPLLLACARSEDEIARRADQLFPTNAVQRTTLDAVMPRALEIFFGAFAGLSLRDQLALQAAAELQGAAAWRAIAGTPGLPPAVRDGVAALSGLEEESNARLGKVLAAWSE